MKFRALLYLGIACVSLLLQFVWAGKYGGMGCAVAISGALLLGQGLVMNLYYHFKQGLDMLAFWKEIARMSVVPLFLCIMFRYVLNRIVLDGWVSLGTAILLFVAIYLPLFIRLGMNESEKNLLFTPLRKWKIGISHDRNQR